MDMLVAIPDVELILSDLRDEMTAASFRAIHQLAQLGITVKGRVVDELDAEAEELRDWVDRVRTAVEISPDADTTTGALLHYTPENPPDRP